MLDEFRRGWRRETDRDTEREHYSRLNTTVLVCVEWFSLASNLEHLLKRAIQLQHHAVKTGAYGLCSQTSTNVTAARTSVSSCVSTSLAPTTATVAMVSDWTRTGHRVTKVSFSVAFNNL